jgi:viroplasmin and RNaseH domain-containing protein
LRRIAYKHDNKPINPIFLNFVRQRFQENKTLTDKQRINELYKQGQEFLLLVEGLQKEVMLLNKYGYLNKMPEREYLEKQAAHVGFKLPPWPETKPII